MKTTLRNAALAVAWIGQPQLDATANDAPDASRGAAAFSESTPLRSAPKDAGVFLLQFGVLPPAQSLSETEWHSVLDTLAGFRSLEDDWDGNGASSPLPGVVDGASSLALHLASTGVASPDLAHVGVNGTVYFEWRTPNGYAEIETKGAVDAIVRWIPNNEQDVFTADLIRVS